MCFCLFFKISLTTELFFVINRVELKLCFVRAFVNLKNFMEDGTVSCEWIYYFDEARCKSYVAHMIIIRAYLQGSRWMQLNVIPRTLVAHMITCINIYVCGCMCVYDCMCILYRKKIHTYLQCSQFLPPQNSTQFFGWLYPIPCDRVIRSGYIFKELLLNLRGNKHTFFSDHFWPRLICE